MQNKYGIDFYETMDVANSYLDLLEDNINSLKNKYIDKPEKLENELNCMKNDYDKVYHFEDLLYVYLDAQDYQSVANQLVMIDMLHAMMRDVLPSTDLSDLSDYLESLSERQLIDEVTRVIDKFNEEVM